MILMIYKLTYIYCFLHEKYFLDKNSPKRTLCTTEVISDWQQCFNVKTSLKNKMVYFKNKLEVTCPQDDPRDIELAIIRNAAEDRPVLLNIGGVRFEMTWELLDKLPQSR